MTLVAASSDALAKREEAEKTFMENSCKGSRR
jgi:hypothetical protein